MRKLFSKLGLPVFFLVNLLASYQTAFAQTADTSSFKVTNYLTAEGQNKDVIKEGVPVVAVYLVRLINYLSLVIGSFAFLAIVIGGFMMVTSAGQEQQVSKGKDMVKFAIIGLLVALSAYFITSFVQSIFYDVGATAK
jgi:hypothetical protein